MWNPDNTQSILQLLDEVIEMHEDNLLDLTVDLEEEEEDSNGFAIIRKGHQRKIHVLTKKLQTTKQEMQTAMHYRILYNNMLGFKLEKAVIENYISALITYKQEL